MVEKGGLKVQDIIAPKNPFKKLNCVEKKCPLYTNNWFVSTDPEKVKITCNTNNVTVRKQSAESKECFIQTQDHWPQKRSSSIQNGNHEKISRPVDKTSKRSSSDCP